MATLCYNLKYFYCMVNTILLEHAIHNNRMKLFMKFEYNIKTIELAKTLAGIKWSHTHKSWYLGYHADVMNLVQRTFVANGIQLKLVNTLDDVEHPKPIDIKKPADVLPHLKSEAREKINHFKYWMRSRRYSESTIGTYTDSMQTFLRYFSDKPISEICNDDLIHFNNEYIIKNKFSASFQNQIVNAVKLFFRSIENKSLQPELIHRPKNPKLLPNVLSKEEVKRILNAHGNIKHKAMLSLIYSCGLRCGELLRLTANDIDNKRSIVIIRQSKGRKDRIAPLSSKIIEILREYYTIYKPQNYLFEGQVKGTMYDERSLQQVLKQALEKSGITKQVTLHWLRHSYATHLLENGTDLRYIQEILGHSSSRTTEIYTHVSTKSIQNVTSPFDYL